MRDDGDLPHATGVRRGHALPRRLLVAALGLLLALLALAPVGPAARLIPVASAHAVLVRSDPADHAVLQAPPSSVHLWFSEEINPLTSRVVVVDPANRQVDRGDSHRDAGDNTELEASLPLLPAGTYVVVWRTQSAVDGHVAGGSFLFQIARPDGSVPPPPKVLPTGNFPGAGGSAVSSGGTLDGPGILQTISTWLALLFMTFWVGGLIWEAWILPPGDAGFDPAVAAAASAAGRRFRRLAPYALAGVLIADAGMILGQSAELAGSFTGAFSPPLLRAILFSSRFGFYWWLRELIALAALGLTLAVARAGVSSHRPADAADRDAPRAAEPPTASDPSAPSAIPDWRRELVATLRAIPRLPRRLVAGWRGLSWAGRDELVLGGVLIVAFALSGHAAAVPANTFAYAISVDLFHLVTEVAWIGGLLYIGVALVPAIARLPERQRARVLAIGLPEFSAVALTCATLLALTGSLNTTIRLTSAEQFLTTAYGRTLAVKIEIFILMAAISAYHAFFLRPRLAHELQRTSTASGADTAPRPAERGTDQVTARAADAVPLAGAFVGVGRTRAATGRPASAAPDAPIAAVDDGGDGDGADDNTGDEATPASLPLSPRARTLEERLRDWLRREAFLGGVVLLCVALLGIFAGSLSPAAPAAGAAASGGLVVQTRQAGPYNVTLKVTPASFGDNTFTVTLKDARGKPVDGAAVTITTIMLDMDMGPSSLQLQPQAALGSGAYTGDTDLTMAGHWQINVKIVPPGSNTPIVAPFKFSAS
ncbi:MAG TPA: copper resistance protein CopC [Ktedonobacterales bacterium]|nr:copper resistance protein CopC [Ktedonobacterales bacterium]